MRWRYQVVVLILCASISCSGCMGSQEIDEISFVLTIGVDKSDQPGLYNYSFRIAMPRSFTGEGGGDNKEKTKVVTVKSQALGEAIRRLAVAMNRQPELSHCSALFIHEDIAKDGIYELLELILRSRSYRNSMIVMVTKDEAKMALEKNTAPFELFQYRWIDSVKRTQKFASSYILNDVRKIYTNSVEPQHAILTAYGSTIDKSLDTPPLVDPYSKTGPTYNVDDFPREGGSELIAVGSVIFKDWKMIGSLNTDESFGADILDKGIKTSITIPDPNDKNEKISIGMDIKRPKIDVVMQDHKMIVTIKAKADVDLLSCSSDINYEAGEGKIQLEQTISDTIKESMMAYFNHTQPLEADCVQISNNYRRNVHTWQEWADIDWPEAYKNAEINIDVKCNILRSGLIWRERNEGVPIKNV